MACTKGMKHNGNKSNHEHHRNSDLMRAYRNEAEKAGSIFLPDLLQRVVNSPSARFWVSPERAAIVIARIMRGDELKEMRPLRREMFFEIYQLAMSLHQQQPDLPVSHLAEIVVHMPAPKFYMTPGSAKVIIHKIKKQRKKKG